MSDEEKIKIVLVGESGVGKTNLIRVANDEDFQEEEQCTISSSYYEKDIIINNKQYTYTLWDTAGQEAYRSLNKMFLKKSKIVIIVFALNDKKSFGEVDFWVNNAKEELKEGEYIMALVGNKSDLFDEQEVPDDDVKKKADELKIEFKLTSAAEDAVGFKQFLEDLIRNYIKKIGFGKGGEKENTFSLEEKNQEENNEGNGGNPNFARKKKKCC